jgi:hypothetical protein
MISLEEIDIDALFAAIGSAGVSMLQIARHLGADVIETPDGVICPVIDAPAVSFERDGLIFDERGVCIGAKDAGEA